MTAMHKIQVKLGPNEFVGEGQREAVQADYEMFLQAIKASPVAPTAPNKANNSANGGAAPQIDRDTLGRVFIVDEATGQVSLRVLPTGDQRETSGLILLLYGFRALANQNDVLSGRLLAAAQTSGLSAVDRVDRFLTPVMDLVTKGGVRAGSRWGLRNTGISRAEEIIRGMM